MMVSLHVNSSFGIASARHCTCVKCPRSHVSLDVPLGMSVCRWEMDTAQRSLFFQAHSDAIMGMRASPDHKFIVTASYSGEVKIWNADWELLATQQAPAESVSYVAWSCDSCTFFTTTNGFESYLTCYQVVSSASNDFSIKLLWNATPPGAITKEEKRAQVQHLSPAKAYKYGNVFSVCEPTISSNSCNCVVLEEKDDENDVIHLFFNAGTILKSQEITSKSDQETSAILAMSSVKDGVCALSLQGGVIVILNSETLETISSFSTGFNSRTIAWDGHSVVLSAGKKITWWSRTGQLVYRFNDLPMDDYTVCLHMGLDHPITCVIGVASLVCLSVVRNTEGVIQSASVLHKLPTAQEISCSGLALSPDLTRVAVGDMVGNAWVYQLGETPPCYHQNIGISVRCLIWHDDSTILIGDLGGNIYKWTIDTGSIELWATLEGSVIHMRLSHSKKLMAVGSSKGVLVVYESDPSTPVISLPAHSPVEIWSICWSPSDDRVATCSEDRSTKVWQCTADWKELAVLKGHTMAVTSVDWSIINGQSILASCSDDQTVRLYNGETLGLQQVLSAVGLIHGWFTLTYLKFYNEGKMLCVTTQNGHLVVWKFGTAPQSASVEYHGRIHNGSIEGLDIAHTKPLVTTCSADCIVHVVSISS